MPHHEEYAPCSNKLLNQADRRLPHRLDHSRYPFQNLFQLIVLIYPQVKMNTAFQNFGVYPTMTLYQRSFLKC